MKKISIPLSKERTKRIYMTLICLIVILAAAYFEYNNLVSEHKKEVFDKMDVTFKTVKAVEYGTANYDPMELVEDISYGKIIGYTESINTNELGNHEIQFILEEENVKKLVKVDAVVVDTNEPEIKLKEDNIVITEGDSLDVMSNINSVIDNVDGDLEYIDSDDDKPSYTIDTDFDANVAGTYTVSVKARDKSGNETTKEYSIDVVPKKIVSNEVIDSNTNSNSNVLVNSNASGIVGEAMKYLGYNYTYGGVSPQTGFDCSGFVYYLYSLYGKNVGRSTSSQLTVGTGISYSEIMPGDIIVWGYGSNPTHSSLYIGNGNIIHAANERDGVIISSVEHWDKYAGDILSIRRVS